MAAMVRRALRIFCVVGMVTLVIAAIGAQFRAFGLSAPIAQLEGDTQGIFLTLGGPGQWTAFIVTYPYAWNPQDLLHLPDFTIIPLPLGLFVPWWLILPTWGLLTALVWRFTRLRKVGRAFPVEPAAK